MTKCSAIEDMSEGQWGRVCPHPRKKSTTDHMSRGITAVLHHLQFFLFWVISKSAAIFAVICLIKDLCFHWMNYWDSDRRSPELQCNCELDPPLSLSLSRLYCNSVRTSWSELLNHPPELVSNTTVLATPKKEFHTN